MPAIAHQNKILGNTSGGGSTILVTTSESSLYGQTITLSDGTTTLTGMFSNAGECEFTGVMMVGTLTATSSTASTSINVPYFGVYSMTLSFFSATITVTYPNEASCTCTGNNESYTASGSPYTFTVHGAATYRVTATIDGISKYEDVVISSDGQTASVTLEFGTINLTYANEFRGQNITCTDGISTFVKTAPNASNSLTFYPPNTGSWTISATYSGNPYSATVTVASLSTPVSAVLDVIPDGATTTPTDSVAKWLQCANIRDKSYTTLSEVLADSETYNALLGDSNACAYMARSTTWASTLCADQYAMNMIGQYDTCCDALLADSTWASAIANSTYWEYVLQPLVPYMTSNTAPSGVASANGEASGHPAWNAFDASGASTYWAPSSSAGAGAYLRYEFPSTVRPLRVEIREVNNNHTTPKYKIQGTNDASSTWTDLTTEITAPTTEGVLESSVLTISDDYKYFQLLYTYKSSGTLGVSVMQFYGRKSSGEKIHGGNPTYDSFYRIVDGNNVPVTDPSLLDAGTYTIYSNGLAKNPSNLSNDYGKTVRICPNTKEIVVRPDNALYWWGYENPNFEILSSASGWSGDYGETFVAPQKNNTNYLLAGTSTLNTVSGFGTRLKITCSSVYAVIKNSVSSLMLRADPNKKLSGTNYVDDSTTVLSKMSLTPASTPCYIEIDGVDTRRTGNAYALWYE